MMGCDAGFQLNSEMLEMAPLSQAETSLEELCIVECMCIVFGYSVRID